MNKKIYFTIQFVIVCFLSISVLAQDNLPKKPNPVKFYNNLSTAFPDFLSSSESNSIENKLGNFSKTSSNQIIVLVVDDLLGYEPWEYATEIGEKWGVGGEKEDNGVIILIKPTGGAGQRKTFIASGRGLEAVIPDFVCSEIVNNELLPNFKSGNFYTGIESASDIIMSLAIKEFNHQEYSAKKSNGELPLWAFFLIFFLIVVFGFFGKSKGGRGGGMYYSSSGFSSGSSGFGGGSSFGGGSFGGGGAGGSW